MSQVAVFDTAFHSDLPPAAFVYPGPYEWVENGIRRYGFHGTSHQYCARRASEILRRDLSDLRLITCHLGNGCSLAAIRGGKSIDTTMGFTPLDGLMMGSRSGAIDPGIIIHLLRQYNLTAVEIDNLLNRNSGLKRFLVTNAARLDREFKAIATADILFDLLSCSKQVVAS